MTIKDYKKLLHDDYSNLAGIIEEFKIEYAKKILPVLVKNTDLKNKNIGDKYH